MTLTCVCILLVLLAQTLNGDLILLPSLLSKALEDLSLQYDSSVRNSENTVVQFVYGDDSLNPEKMESNDRPIDFDRLHLHIGQTHPCAGEPGMRPSELTALVKERLAADRFQRLLPKGLMFLEEIREFFASITEKQTELLDDANVSDDAFEHLSWNSCRLTATQVDLLFDTAFLKYTSAYVEPGEAVGATGAQSISEPGTQMTLKVRDEML